MNSSLVFAFMAVGFIRFLLPKKQQSRIPLTSLLVELLIRNACISLEFLDKVHKSQLLIFQGVRQCITRVHPTAYVAIGWIAS
jgi:hypothetical protein